MKQLFCLFWVCIGLSASAQTTFIRVVDAGSQNPLPRTTIQSGDSLRKFTDDKGVCRMSLTFPATLRVSYIGYKTKLVTFKKYHQDTLLVKLEREKQLLEEVKVLPELPKFIYFGSPDMQVIDYEFMDSYVLVGVYHNLKQKCTLLVLDSANKITDEQPLPADFERFYVSGINRYYAVAGSAVQEIKLFKSMVTLKTINSDFFYDKVVYYKGFYNDYLYIMETHPSKQVHFYYVEHVTQPQNTIRVMTILGNQHQYNAYRKDVELMKLHRQADLQKLYSLIGAAADDGYYQTETKGEFARKAFYDTKYKELYSQLFVTDSGVCVLDFIEGYRQLFSFDGSPLGFSPITFHQQPGWKPFVQQSGKDYYTVYELNEQLRVTRVVRNFSETLSGQVLYHPQPQQWKIHGRYVYYLNTPKGYPFNVFLFREVLQ